MARVPFVDRESLDPEGQAIYERIRSDRNAPKVGFQFRALLNSPQATSHLTSMGTQLRFHSALPEDLKELAIIIAAREWNSHIEWTAHAAIAEKAGVSKAVIEAVRTHKAPISGQSRTSDLAMKVAGIQALMTNTSSHETWFITSMQRGGRKSGALPASSFTDRMASSWRDQRRTSPRCAGGDRRG